MWYLHLVIKMIIAKFKFRQYPFFAISPNLIPAKFPAIRYFQSARAFVSELSVKTHRRTHQRTQLRGTLSSAGRLLNFLWCGYLVSDVSRWSRVQIQSQSGQIRKFFWGSMPPDPPSEACFACSPSPHQQFTCSAAPGCHRKYNTFGHNSGQQW